MSRVFELSTEELRARRGRLLARVGMKWERLSELAASHTLDTDERNVYGSIRAIGYLLGDD